MPLPPPKALPIRSGRACVAARPRLKRTNARRREQVQSNVQDGRKPAPRRAHLPGSDSRTQSPCRNPQSVLTNRNTQYHPYRIILSTNQTFAPGASCATKPAGASPADLCIFRPRAALAANGSGREPFAARRGRSVRWLTAGMHVVCILLVVGLFVGIELGTMAYFQSVANSSMTASEGNSAN